MNYSYSNKIKNYMNTESYTKNLSNSLNALMILLFSYKYSYVSEDFLQMKFPEVTSYIQQFYKCGAIEGNPSIFGGSSHYLIALNELQHQGINVEYNKNETIKLLTLQYDYLTNEYLNKKDNKLASIDYVSGNASILHTFCLENFISKAQYTKIIESESKKLDKLILGMKENRFSDFGFAHGLAGIFNSSCSFSKKFDASSRIDNYKEFLTYMLSNYYEINNIPYWREPNSSEDKIYRMSWCYGSQTILLSILHIAEYVQDYELSKWCKEKLNLILIDSNSLENLETDCVCHGGSSYFNTLFALNNTQTIPISIRNISDPSYRYDQDDFLSGTGGSLLTEICINNNESYTIKQLGLSIL